MGLGASSLGPTTVRSWCDCGFISGKTGAYGESVNGNLCVAMSPPIGDNRRCKLGPERTDFTQLYDVDLAKFMMLRVSLRMNHFGADFTGVFTVLLLDTRTIAALSGGTKPAKPQQKACELIGKYLWFLVWKHTVVGALVWDDRRNEIFD